MKTFAKILFASALTASFALPALAAEESTLAERNTYIYANGVETQLPAGAEAFAAVHEPRHKAVTRARATQDHINSVDPGIASQS